MLIRCPECHFERDIDGDTIPANATVATCPRCGTRFRFRDPHNAQTAPAPSPADQATASGSGEPQADTGTPAPPVQAPVPHLPTEQEGDDPLPPGAVIPHMDEDGPDQTSPANAASGDSARQRNTDKTGQPSAPDSDAHSPTPWPSDNSFGQSGQEHGDNDVPWENPERYGFFSSFFQTILRVMFHAPDFFRQLGGSSAPLTRPIFFYVLLSFFQTLMTRLWSMNSLQELSQGITDPQMLARIDTLMQGLNTPLMLVMTPFIMIVQLFAFAAFYHLMIRLAQPDRADFGTVVRVIAYSAAPLVISVVPLMGTAGSMWFLASTFVGCKYALNLSWPRTALALLPLFLLALAVMMAMLQASLILTPGS